MSFGEKRRSSVEVVPFALLPAGPSFPMATSGRDLVRPLDEVVAEAQTARRDSVRPMIGSVERPVLPEVRRASNKRSLTGREMSMAVLVEESEE